MSTDSPHITLAMVLGGKKDDSHFIDGEMGVRVTRKYEAEAGRGL